jgi:hypothetical protein
MTTLLSHEGPTQLTRTGSLNVSTIWSVFGSGRIRASVNNRKDECSGEYFDTNRVSASSEVQQAGTPQSDTALYLAAF